MRVVVINGTGGVGKDTFIYLCKFATPPGYIRSYSSVDRVKEYAHLMGWSGGKTEKDRKFLSDLKKALVDWKDIPFSSMQEYFKCASEDKNCHILFLHIREPEEIKRAVNEFNAVTLLIKNKRVKPIESNHSDAEVFNYHYDFVISNDGTIGDLSVKAKKFVEEVM